MKRTFLPLAVLACAFAIAAPAGAQSLPKEFTLSLVEGELQAAGYDFQAVGAGFQVMTDDDHKIVIMRQGCTDDDRCMGLSLVAIHKGFVSLENANKFNNAYSYAKLVTSGKQVFLQRYLIADAGVPSGLIANEIALLSNFADNVHEVVE